jgi:hypothetical protein
VLNTVITAAVLGFVGFRLVGAAHYSTGRQGRSRVLRILRGIRWRHVLPVPFLLAAVLGAALLLVQLPLLSWGWWAAIGGVGNPVTGGTEEVAGTALEWALPLLFLGLLLPSVPLFAEREEEIFRLGAEEWRWPKRVGKALLFGLAHAVIGIPLGVALALSIGGGWFQACYLNEYRRTGDRAAALLESTRAHTAYNLTILSVVLLATAALALGT